MVKAEAKLRIFKEKNLKEELGNEEAEKLEYVQEYVDIIQSYRLLQNPPLELNSPDPNPPPTPNPSPEKNLIPTHIQYKKLNRPLVEMWST